MVKFRTSKTKNWRFQHPFFKGALSLSLWKAKRYVLISDSFQTMIPFRIKVVYKWGEDTYCCHLPRMMQLNRDYDLIILNQHFQVLSLWVGNMISRKKNTGLLSLGGSLDIFLLWLQKCFLFWTKVLGHNFTTVLTRKQQMSWQYPFNIVFFFTEEAAVMLSFPLSFKVWDKLPEITMNNKEMKCIITMLCMQLEGTDKLPIYYLVRFSKNLFP